MTKMIFRSVGSTLGLGDEGTIEGLAWSFSTPDRFGDTIERGAFKSAVGKKLPLLWAHDQAEVLGAWDAITERRDGLHVRGKMLLDDVPKAREVRALVQAGAVGGLSIGFLPLESSPRKGGGRTFKNIELLEVSVVAVPAHAGTSVSAKDFSTFNSGLAEAFHRAARAFSRG